MDSGFQDSRPRALSVSELNHQARHLLEASFMQVWVEGELSGFSRPSSGHWYFSLKDRKCQIRCAMFRGFNQRVKDVPKEGEQVRIRGKVTLYENRGDFQIIVEHVEPAGLGALQQAYEELKRKLQMEGLFDAARKKTLPPTPRHIGVVTSPTGAAIHDILTVLARRCPAIPVTLYPTAVQGQAATADIVRAIDRAARHGLADVLIIGRGGGSLEDLWCFNEEAVARAIAACPLPTVSAVGHEVDVTIADFVADLRAPTPSAAAELISPDQLQIRQRAGQLHERLLRTQHQKLSRSAQYLLQLQQRLRGPQHILQSQSQQLDHLEMRLHQVMNQKLTNHQHQLSRVEQRLSHQHPRLVLDQYRRSLAQLQQRLERNAQEAVRNRQNQLESQARLLHSVSPLNVLNRGYSISLNEEGQALHSARDLKPGDVIETRLKSDRIKSQITDIDYDAS